MKSTPLRVAMLALVFGTMMAGSVSAQVQRSPRAYRGLFGGNGGGPQRSQSLDFTFSVDGGYDDNATADQNSGTTDPRLQPSSWYSGAGASLGYARQAQRWGLQASASGNARYYTDLDDLTGLNFGSAVGFSYELTRQTRFTANQAVSFTPYFQYGFFPSLYLPDIGDQIAFSPDLMVTKREAWQYDTSVSLSYSLTQRSSMEGHYHWYMTDFRASDFQDLGSQSAGGSYRYSFTKNVSLRAGYTYSRGRYAVTQDTNRVYGNHNIDAGIDYGRSFSFSRRTTFSFSTGTTATSYSGDNLTEGTRTYFNVVGSATLNHQMGRTWTAALMYQRNVAYQPGLSAPTLNDNVSATANGNVTDRTYFFAGAFYTRGDVGFGSRVNNNYDTASTYAGLQFALTEYIALEGRYFYYHYVFANRAYLPLDLPVNNDRQGAQMSLVIWLPLMR